VLKTVVNWRFRPGTRNGQPVVYRHSMRIRFDLDELD